MATLIASIPDYDSAFGSGQNPFSASRFDAQSSSSTVRRSDSALAETFSTTTTAQSGNAVGESSGAISAPLPSSITIAEGATAEISGPGTQNVNFTGTTGTLTIDHSLAFTGHV